MSTESTDKKYKVVIVGGGIAGLATAHYLERAKEEGWAPPSLQVTVYERNEEDNNSTKYPMQISPDARSALQKILSTQEYSNLTTQSNYGITHGGVNILNPDLSHLFSNIKYQNEQPQWIHRKVLKDMLSVGVNITRGKRVVRVREVEAKVEVVFEDGANELADLVIGADGIGSIVRSQTHPSFPHFPLIPYVLIQFKLATPIAKLPLQLNKDCQNTILGSHSNYLLIIPLHGIDLPRMTPRSAITLSEQGPFAEPDQSVLKVQDSLKDTQTGYVLVRMLSNVSGEGAAGWEDLTEGAWIDKILDILKKDGTDQGLLQIIENDSIPGTISSTGVVSSALGKHVPYKDGKVFLIGDAAHAVPPTNGNGGAAALLDAQGIVETLLTCSELGPGAAPLTSYHRSLIRTEAYLKGSLHLLENSTTSGWSGFIQKSRLKLRNSF
ncbi:hypothetical protein V865_001877 [Kwoniella europaea PYCC6329]|uniref:FAD-binding domain-containing protein n=1 Tax=Kwoniella europaea PYCC6329 TaxID=1423913 RepID=A0AAX4KBA4_9TREE